MPLSSEQAQNQWFVDEVKQHEPLLRGYLSKQFPSLPDHDDIVQEAYIRMLRTIENGYPTSAKAFLFTIARNVAIDMLRRRQTSAHERLSDFAELPVLEEMPGVPERLEHQQRHEALVEAIASLPVRCREAIKLRYVDGLAYKEIAERLGISPSTVRLHLVKGTRDCAAFFRSRGLLEAVSSLSCSSSNESATTP